MAGHLTRNRGLQKIQARVRYICEHSQGNDLRGYVELVCLIAVPIITSISNGAGFFLINRKVRVCLENLYVKLHIIILIKPR